MTKKMLSAIEYIEDQFPTEILKQIIDQKEAVIPELLEILKHTNEHADELVGQDKYFAHIYALYLLAQFREKKAFPLIIDLMGKPYNEVLDDILGDVITEDLPRILASVYDGDFDSLKSIIENCKANEFVRGSVLRSLSVMAAQGIISREDIIEYFISLFHGKLESETSNVWNELAECCYYLYPDEMINDLEKAFDEYLVDTLFKDFNDFREQVKRGKEIVLAELANNRSYRLIDDTISELEHWDCFNTNSINLDFNPPYWFDEQDDEIDDELEEIKPQPYHNELKIGRNEPCPCGSGKKYKKCCGK